MLFFIYPKPLLKITVYTKTSCTKSMALIGDIIAQHNPLQFFK